MVIRPQFSFLMKNRMQCRLVSFCFISTYFTHKMQFSRNKSYECNVIYIGGIQIQSTRPRFNAGGLEIQIRENTVNSLQKWWNHGAINLNYLVTWNLKFNLKVIWKKIRSKFVLFVLYSLDFFNSYFRIRFLKQSIGIIDFWRTTLAIGVQKYSFWRTYDWMMNIIQWIGL